MKSNSSIDHHYLPKFYLKEFCNSSNKFYVYDKERDVIKNGSHVPKSHFYEKYRNSFKLGNDNFDHIENAYSQLDNNFALNYKELINRSYNSISEREHINVASDILRIVNFIRWRVPARDYITRNILKENKLIDLPYYFFDKKTGNKILESDKLSELLELKVINQFQPLLIYLAPWNNYLHLKEVSETLKLDEIIMKNLMISDNPFIERTISKNIFEIPEFFFPFTKDKLAFYIKDDVKDCFDTNFGYIFQLALFESATKFVASHNLDVLEYYVREYRENRKSVSFINELFKSCKKDG